MDHMLLARRKQEMEAVYYYYYYYGKFQNRAQVFQLHFKLGHSTTFGVFRQPASLFFTQIPKIPLPLLPQITSQETELLVAGNGE